MADGIPLRNDPSIDISIHDSFSYNDRNYDLSTAEGLFRYEYTTMMRGDGDWRLGLREIPPSDNYDDDEINLIFPDSDKRGRLGYDDDTTLRGLLPEVSADHHDCAICLQDLASNSSTPEDKDEDEAMQEEEEDDEEEEMQEEEEDDDEEEEEEEVATPRAMPCSHVFHECCIFKWVRVNRSCPVCRRTLPTPEPPQRLFSQEKQEYEYEYDYHDDDRLQLTMPVPREMLQIEVL